MKTSNEDIQRKVRQWVSYADEDLRMTLAAMNLRSDEEPPYRLIAFHAQQCAEKYLKAYLMSGGVEFPYTHNISTLLELCSDHAAWHAKLRDAEELTAYAITTRYPGEDEEVTKAEAIRAVELAQQVRTIVRSDLQKLGLQIPQ
jgi:HEPN domain-containing protein